MRPFTTFSSHGVPFHGADTDTDRILPARFLSKPRAGGFAQYLFHDLRFREDGSTVADFVLNHPHYQNAEILVCEENFGCGSSRENAVWAISDYGFRVVVAPSFGDIFYSNCLKNGVLAVVLKPEATAAIRASLVPGSNAAITVDLTAQTITAPGGEVYRFEIDPFSKHCLLNGIDEMDYTLAQMDEIDAFERRREIDGRGARGEG
jgi:3-isopropylmalate/(R)-2-methylmalate dehydratase small subunit